MLVASEVRVRAAEETAISAAKPFVFQPSHFEHFLEAFLVSEDGTTVGRCVTPLMSPCPQLVPSEESSHSQFDSVELT